MAPQVLHDFQQELIKIKGDKAYGHTTDPILLSKILQLNSFSKMVCRLIPLQRKCGTIEAIVCTTDDNGIQYMDSDSFRHRDFDLEYPECPTPPRNSVLGFTRRSVYPAKVTFEDTDPEETPDSSLVEPSVPEVTEEDLPTEEMEGTSSHEADVRNAASDSREIRYSGGSGCGSESSKSPDAPTYGNIFTPKKTFDQPNLNNTFTVDETDNGEQKNKFYNTEKVSDKEDTAIDKEIQQTITLEKETVNGDMVSPINKRPDTEEVVQCEETLKDAIESDNEKTKEPLAESSPKREENDMNGTFTRTSTPNSDGNETNEELKPNKLRNDTDTGEQKATAMSEEDKHKKENTSKKRVNRSKNRRKKTVDETVIEVDKILDDEKSPRGKEKKEKWEKKEKKGKKENKEKKTAVDIQGEENPGILEIEDTIETDNEKVEQEPQTKQPLAESSPVRNENDMNGTFTRTSTPNSDGNETNEELKPNNNKSEAQEHDSQLGNGTDTEEQNATAMSEKDKSKKENTSKKRVNRSKNRRKKTVDETVAQKNISTVDETQDDEKKPRGKEKKDKKIKETAAGAGERTTGKEGSEKEAKPETKRGRKPKNAKPRAFSEDSVNSGSADGHLKQSSKPKSKTAKQKGRLSKVSDMAVDEDPGEMDDTVQLPKVDDGEEEKATKKRTKGRSPKKDVTFLDNKNENKENDQSRNNNDVSITISKKKSRVKPVKKFSVTKKGEDTQETVQSGIVEQKTSGTRTKRNVLAEKIGKEKIDNIVQKDHDNTKGKAQKKKGKEKKVVDENPPKNKDEPEDGNVENIAPEVTEAKPTRSRRAAAKAATSKISETANTEPTPKQKKRGRPHKQ